MILMRYSISEIIPIIRTPQGVSGFEILNESPKIVNDAEIKIEAAINVN